MATTPQKTRVSATPAMVCVYSKPKGGKTTDAAYGAPRSLFVAEPAALRPTLQVVGYEPDPSAVRNLKRIKNITEVLTKLSGDFDAVVVDDLSVITEWTYEAIRTEYKGTNEFESWTLLRKEIMNLVRTARECGKHVIFTAHEQPPKVRKTGGTLRGGPKLPTDLPEWFSGQLDIVLRACPEPTRRGAWKMVYRCTETDPNYTSGDRNGMTPDMAPMNIGEIMRAAGYALRRAPGLEWIDPMAEWIATNVLQAPAYERAIVEAAVQTMRTNYTPNDLHIRWALRDGLDRATLRAARQNLLNAFLMP